MVPNGAPLAALAALSSFEARVAVARERLRGDPKRTADALEVLLADNERGRPAARVATLACALALAQSDGAPWLVALAAAAAPGSRVARLFVRGSPHRQVHRLPDPYVPASLAPLLADRVARHSLHKSGALDRLLVHPDATVQRRVLAGRATTIRDVVVVASRRPLGASVAQELVRSLRWMGEAAVREAMVANPFTPPSLALKLVPTLLAPARRELAASSLHPAVVLAARAPSR